MKSEEVTLAIFINPKLFILFILLFYYVRYINLCVGDMSGTVNNCECLKYPDDTTIYQHCKVKDIK